MATVVRTCKKCRRQFRVPNQLRREYCEECRPPRFPPGTITSIPGNSEEIVPAAALRNVNKPGDGIIETVVRGELQAIDREGSVPGALALRLAAIKAGDTFIGKAVPTSARWLTRSGAWAAVSSAISEPKLWPTKAAFCMPTTSSIATTAALASSTLAGGSPPLLPCPGRSIASTFQPWWAR